MPKWIETNEALKLLYGNSIYVPTMAGRIEIITQLMTDQETDDDGTEESTTDLPAAGGAHDPSLALEPVP